MAKLLLIYFSALSFCMLVPAKISDIPFLNLSNAIHFNIDLSSPVISVEKDFMEVSYRAPASNEASTNLNQFVGIPQTQPNVKKMVLASAPILDYSGSVRKDSGVHLDVSGPLELRQGLALTDENRIEVHRENRGETLEYGEIDIQKGTYTIRVSNLEGHVCARLRGLRHELVGEGCFSLDRINSQNKSTLNGPLLSISQSSTVLASTSLENQVVPVEKTQAKPEPKPIERKIADSRILDFYDYDNPGAKSLPVDTSNSVNGKEDPQSTVITYMQSKNHAPIRVVSNSYTPSRGAVLPSRKAERALREIAREQGLIASDAVDESGVIWGRAMNEGRAVAGVSVEVEGRDDLQPVYLNEFYMPDPNLKSTASHGLYSFIGVSDGEYSLRATRGNTFMGFQNVSVREKSLSIGDIDATERRRTTRLALYDMVNKTSQSAVVTLQNYDEDIVVEGGTADVNVQDNRDTAYALVNPLNKRYLTAQYSLQPNEELYNFPLVTSQWMEELLSRAKLQRAVQNRVVLGIGAQAPYQVRALGSKTAQVVYFNAQGEITEGNFGSAGGGFLIIDPEDHVSEYAIQLAGEKTIRAVYMPTVPNILNVIQL